MRGFNSSLAFYHSMSYRKPSRREAVRIYKLKAFRRFQRRERIANRALVKAVREAERGLIDADLGGGLVKQRIPRPGQGKSGGYRTILAYRRGDRAVYLFGFAKSDRDNLDADEMVYWQMVGRSYLDLDDDELDAATVEDELTELSYDDED